MSAEREIPQTLRDAKSYQANAKRRLSSFVKDGKTLLLSEQGIPSSEFKLHASRIREQLDNLQTANDYVIQRQCGELADYPDEKELEKAEQEITDLHENYYDEVRDSAVPTMYDLLRQAHVLDESQPGRQPLESDLSVSPPSTAAVSVRTAKIKFPTFSGDLRDYKRFKEQFLHYSKSLGETECFHQLVESMERKREKNKIKNCVDVKRAWEILNEA